MADPPDSASPTEPYMEDSFDRCLHPDMHYPLERPAIVPSPYQYGAVEPTLDHEAPGGAWSDGLEAIDGFDWDKPEHLYTTEEATNPVGPSEGAPIQNPTGQRETVCLAELEYHHDMPADPPSLAELASYETLEGEARLPMRRPFFTSKQRPNIHPREHRVIQEYCKRACSEPDTPKANLSAVYHNFVVHEDLPPRRPMARDNGVSPRSNFNQTNPGPPRMVSGSIRAGNDYGGLGGHGHAPSFSSPAEASKYKCAAEASTTTWPRHVPNTGYVPYVEGATNGFGRAPMPSGLDMAATFPIPDTPPMRSGVNRALTFPGVESSAMCSSFDCPAFDEPPKRTGPNTDPGYFDFDESLECTEFDEFLKSADSNKVPVLTAPDTTLPSPCAESTSFDVDRLPMFTAVDTSLMCPGIDTTPIFSDSDLMPTRAGSFSSSGSSRRSPTAAFQGLGRVDPTATTRPALSHLATRGCVTEQGNCYLVNQARSGVIWMFEKPPTSPPARRRGPYIAESSCSSEDSDRDFSDEDALPSGLGAHASTRKPAASRNIDRHICTDKLASPQKAGYRAQPASPEKSSHARNDNLASSLKPTGQCRTDRPASYQKAVRFDLADELASPQKVSCHAFTDKPASPQKASSHVPIAEPASPQKAAYHASTDTRTSPLGDSGHAIVDDNRSGDDINLADDVQADKLVQDEEVQDKDTEYPHITIFEEEDTDSVNAPVEEQDAKVLHDIAEELDAEALHAPMPTELSQTTTSEGALSVPELPMVMPHSGSSNVIHIRSSSPTSSLSEPPEDLHVDEYDPVTIGIANPAGRVLDEMSIQLGLLDDEKPSSNTENKDTEDHSMEKPAPFASSDAVDESPASTARPTRKAAQKASAMTSASRRTRAPRVANPSSTKKKDSDFKPGKRDKDSDSSEMDRPAKKKTRVSRSTSNRGTKNSPNAKGAKKDASTKSSRDPVDGTYDCIRVDPYRHTDDTFPVHKDGDRSGESGISDSDTLSVHASTGDDEHIAYSPTSFNHGSHAESSKISMGKRTLKKSKATAAALADITSSAEDSDEDSEIPTPISVPKKRTTRTASKANSEHDPSPTVPKSKKKPGLSNSSTTATSSASKNNTKDKRQRKPTEKTKSKEPTKDNGKRKSTTHSTNDTDSDAPKSKKRSTNKPKSSQDVQPNRPPKPILKGNSSSSSRIRIPHPPAPPPRPTPQPPKSPFQAPIPKFRLPVSPRKRKVGVLVSPGKSNSGAGKDDDKGKGSKGGTRPGSRKDGGGDAGGKKDGLSDSPSTPPRRRPSTRAAVAREERDEMAKGRQLRGKAKGKGMEKEKVKGKGKGGGV